MLMINIMVETRVYKSVLLLINGIKIIHKKQNIII